MLPYTQTILPLIKRKIKSYIPINEKKVKSLMKMVFQKNDVKEKHDF